MPLDPRFRAASELALLSLGFLETADFLAREGKNAEAAELMKGVGAFSTGELSAVLRDMREDLARVADGHIRTYGPSGREYPSAHEAVETLWSLIRCMYEILEWPVPDYPLRTLGVNTSELHAHIVRERAKLLGTSTPTPEPGLASAPATITRSATDAKPRKLLTGYREIAPAAGMRYADRNKLKSLNQRFAGPIKHQGKGSWPIVYSDELVDWLNTLAVLHQESANRREGAKLSAEAQHDYGRDGTVAPGIGGGVKKRRRDKRI